MPTLLQAIKGLLDDQNLVFRPMRPWSERAHRLPTGGRYQLRKDILNILKLLSGDDIKAMIKGDF